MSTMILADVWTKVAVCHRHLPNSASDLCQDEEEEKEAQEETDPMKKMFKQMDYIEPRLPMLLVAICLQLCRHL